MNDLAEKALQSASAARRRVAGRPVPALTVAGLLVSAFVVVAGGAVADARPTRTLSTWFGLQSDHRLGAPVPSSLLLVGVVGLVLLWLLTVDVVRRTALPESRVWLLVMAYAAPFAVGPPLMDTTVYGYAAFGIIQRTGRAPSTTAPSALGDDSLVNAIVPGSRDTVSASGPLGSLLQHLAVSVGGGSALGAVVVLRVVGVLAAVAIGRLAADLAADRGAGGPGRTLAIALTTLNPLVLLYVVSSPHLDGPMLALALAALVAVRRRRWLPAVALASLAGAVSAQALVIVPVVIVAHALRRRSALWRVLVRDVSAAVAITAVLGLVVPDGTGWLRAVGEQFSSHTPYSIPYATGRILAPIVSGSSYDDLAVSGRITAVAAAACIVAYLLVSARHRSPQATAGFALLAMALLAPNLYPWYLLWGLLCLAPAASRERRAAVLALSAAGCVLLPPGFGTLPASLVSAAGLAVIAVAWGTCTLRRRDTANEVSAPAGHLSDGGSDVGQVDHRDHDGREREHRGDAAGRVRRAEKRAQ